MGAMQVGAMQQRGGGGDLNFVHNQLVTFWSIYFGRRGRSGLNFVHRNQMLKIRIPFLLSTEGW